MLPTKSLLSKKVTKHATLKTHKSPVLKLVKKKSLKTKHYRNQKQLHHTKVDNNIKLLIRDPVNRVTVKRGIFPHTIRTDFLTKQLIPQHGAVESDTVLANSHEIEERSSPESDFLKKITAEGNTKKSYQARRVSTSNDSPLLIQRTDQELVIYENKRESEMLPKTPKNDLRVLMNIRDLSTSNFTQNSWVQLGDNTNSDLQKNEKGLKRKYQSFKEQVTQIETCCKREAQQILIYHEFAQSINRLMIIERETHFGKFPDAMQTLREKLSKLKAERSDQTRNFGCNVEKENLSSSEEDSAGQPLKKDIEISEPMEISDSEKLTFHVPLFDPISTKNEAKMNKKTERNKFGFNEKARLAFKFTSRDAYKNINNKCTENNIIIRTQKKKFTDRTSNNFEFNLHQTKSTFDNEVFSFNSPSFAVPDTIDQNAGLGAVEYLENISKNKTADDRKTRNKKHKDELKIWESHLGKDQDIRKHIANELAQHWPNNPLFSEKFPTERFQYLSRREEEYCPPKRFTGIDKNYSLDNHEERFDLHSDFVEGRLAAKNYRLPIPPTIDEKLRMHNPVFTPFNKF